MNLLELKKIVLYFYVPFVSIDHVIQKEHKNTKLFLMVY